MKGTAGARLMLRMSAWVILCFGTRALADTVTPTEDVTSFVFVRQSASVQSAALGSLRPGEHAELLGSVPDWYPVQLANGVSGFVSARWTRTIDVTPPPSGTGAFTIDVVDVGTDLGVLIRGADFTMVYDGGSNDDLARAIWANSIS